MFLQMGCLKCDNITQAAKIHIKTKTNIPMQIDGEPVVMEPIDIKIELKNQVSMIQAEYITPSGCKC